MEAGFSYSRRDPKSKFLSLWRSALRTCCSTSKSLPASVRCWIYWRNAYEPRRTEYHLLQGTADLFIGPGEFSNPLIAEGKPAGASRTAFARSSTGLCVRAGGPKPDISTPVKLKSALLAAGAVSYSKGASGIHFVKALEKLGIADAVAAKLVPPAPGELVGAVVARGAADIGAQQFSELLPVSGIDILGPLPPELQQTIVYGATAFLQSKEREAAQDFVKFLRSEPARKVLRKKGLEPA